MTLTALLPAFLPAVLWAQSDVLQRYSPCVNYFVVGESPCQPLASTPVIIQQVAAPQTQTPALMNPVPAPKSEVDTYLENYGKPPREFVEFYLHPTAENAMKWVNTYNSLIQRSQSLSRSWNQADELYKAAKERGINPMLLVSGTSLNDYGTGQYAFSPSHTDALTLAADTQAAKLAQTTSNLAAKKSEVRLGAFAGSSDQVGEMSPVHLTYFFSATCPYCAKMTPELSNIFKEMKGKLTLTCVDVTPLSATHKPDPANIEGKLPCAWRTPTEGEVESVPVQQTPTMLISRSGADKPTRLSGYVPASTLMVYLTGAATQPAGASTVPVMGQFR